MLATAPISTTFLTLSGLSTAILGAIMVPSLCPISVAFLVALTSGCCNSTDNAFSASCFRSLNVTFPHTLLSDSVKLELTPLLSYLSTTNPLSDSYSAIWKNDCLSGYFFIPVLLSTSISPPVSFRSFAPEP